MAVAIAFDIYDTLIDTHGVIRALSDKVGDEGPRFSALWREKQLEYLFRRGLMGAYRDFNVCTRQALDYVDAALQTGLGEDDKAALMAVYRALPAFPEVQQSLAALYDRDCTLHALSNGLGASVEGLLENAGIRQFFRSVLSVDALQTFKPAPAVYHYFAEQAGVGIGDAWLVSSNGFDVIGAIAAGMRAVRLKRGAAPPLDPWEFEPTAEICALAELGGAIGLG